MQTQSNASLPWTLKAPKATKTNRRRLSEQDLLAMYGKLNTLSPVVISYNDLGLPWHAVLIANGQSVSSPPEVTVRKRASLEMAMQVAERLAAAGTRVTHLNLL